MLFVLEIQLFSRFGTSKVIYLFNNALYFPVSEMWQCLFLEVE